MAINCTCSPALVDVASFFEYLAEEVRGHFKSSLTHTIFLCLFQSSTRKSALLSAAKKARLKNNPIRVRFAESVDINGVTPATHDSVVPLMPNVLKVFLENGQTKSFKYDGSTTVQDVIDSLQAKLGLASAVYFALVVEHIKSLRRNKLTILDPKERLAAIASRPGAHNLRCLFRVTYVPMDSAQLLRDDRVAFEYLYAQCCNDVVQERFAPELKYDVALRLAALHLQQHAIANGVNAGAAAKMAVKAVEKECGGLERFVPTSLAESTKRKELRKLLVHFLKSNASLPMQEIDLSDVVDNDEDALRAKLHYLKIIGDLPSYGAKCFSTNISDSNVETVILVSPKFGISQINSLRNSVVGFGLYREMALIVCSETFSKGAFAIYLVVESWPTRQLKMKIRVGERKFLLCISYETLFFREGNGISYSVHPL